MKNKFIDNANYDSDYNDADLTNCVLFSDNTVVRSVEPLNYQSGIIKAEIKIFVYLDNVCALCDESLSNGATANG